MKELTIEEKAKAYDEALKVIKDNLDALNEITESGVKIVNIQAIKNCFYRAFPELKESEDEKIRKALIRFHKSTIDVDGIKGADILAWLEKQDNNSTSIDIDEMVMKYSQTKDGDFGLPVNCMIRAYRQGINDALNLSSCIEKQGEQKPAEWSEEDENVLEDIEEAIINYWHGDTQDILLDWLKSLKQRIGG